MRLSSASSTVGDCVTLFRLGGSSDTFTLQNAITFPIVNYAYSLVPDINGHFLYVIFSSSSAVYPPDSVAVYSLDGTPRLLESYATNGFAPIIGVH